MTLSLLTRALAKGATIDLESQATLRNYPLVETLRVRTVMRSGAADYSDQVLAVAARKPATPGEAAPAPERVAAARQYLREAIADDAETYRQAASMDRTPATALALGGLGMIAAALFVMSGPAVWLIAATGAVATASGLYARSRANRFHQAAAVETAALTRVLGELEKQ